MAMDPSERIIKQIDDALARYYAMKNTKYYDDDKVGKFMTYCHENGLDDDTTIDEEFEQDDPAESLLVDFDDNFPGIDANDADKSLKILRILKNCRENETAYMETGEMYSSFTVSRRDWMIAQRDKAKTEKIYLTQCPTIFDRKFQEDKTILRLLTVGVKIDKPYLTYLADTFQRERVEHLDKDINFTIPLWQHTNRHLKELKAIDYRRDTMDKTAYDSTVSAIHSYFGRVCPQLMFYPPIFIEDSLRETCEYLAGIVDFVASVAADKYTSCPFQFDCVFAFNKVSKSPHQAMPGFFKDTDDDDDDDDEEEDFGHIDYDDDYKEKPDKATQFYDCFGSIKKRLEKEKLPRLCKEVPSDKDNVGTTTKKRVFKMQFDEFKEKIIKKKYGQNKEEFEQYPRKHRLCAVVDRRKPDNAENKDKDLSEADEVLMFEPPDDCNTLVANNPQSLAYFNASRTCIIPEFGYSENKKSGDKTAVKDQTSKEKDQTATITAISPCKGAMMLFSFHAVTVDEIRCYLFVNGQCIRFMPQDIVKILPQFFDPQYADNDAFVISDRARVLIKDMRNKLRDIPFKAFLNRNRSTEHDIQESRNRYNKFILM